MATKEMTLTELRKEASRVGIKNYAKYSKDILFELVKAAESGIKICSDEEFENDVPVDEETGEVDLQIDFKTEEEVLIEKKATTFDESRVVGILPVAPKATARVKAPKVSKEVNVNIQTQTSNKAVRRLSQDVIDEILKRDFKTISDIEEGLFGATSPKIGSQTELIYHTIIMNPTMALNQVAKQSGCYYSSVQRVAEKYFGMSFEIKTRSESTDASETNV